MNKYGARSILPAAERERRVIALKMRESGETFVRIAEVVGANTRMVQKWLSRVETLGEALAIAGEPRGFPVGTHRQLSAEQESEIQTLSVEGMPDQLKMPYALWTRKVVRDLIEDQTGS